MEKKLIKANCKVEDLIKELIPSDTIDAVENFSSKDDFQKSDVDKIGEMLGYQNGAPFSSMEQEKKTHLITSFKKNLALLIQKTWVEAHDNALKEEVLYRLGLLFEERNIDWKTSYAPFLNIIKKAIFLMFGEQFGCDDFTEYALRIDGGFGIFWWFVASLPEEPVWGADKCEMAVLLGMYFLANY